MASVNIFKDENAEMLAPLCCEHTLQELFIAGTTYGSLLAERWERIASGRTISASSVLFPSDELLAAIPVAGDFTVRNAEGGIFAHSGEKASGADVPIDGKSILVTYPWDFIAVNEYVLAGIKESSILGTVREGAHIDGTVILGEGSVILPGVYIEGVAVIGKDCKIGPNCYLRGFNSIGDKCHIGQAVEIKNSILQYKVAAGHLSYIGDSVVGSFTNFGAGTITSNFRHDGKNHRSKVCGKIVDTGRRKFGSIIGENVHTGIHTSIYPGRKIWAHMMTLPGDVVKHDITE